MIPDLDHLVTPSSPFITRDNPVPLSCNSLVVTIQARKYSQTLAALAMLLVAARLPAATAKQTGPLTLVGTIPLKGVEGRLDHLTVDLASRKLFVAALENHSIEVVDIAKRRRVQHLPAINEPQGLLFLPEQNLLFICSRGDGTCRTFDTRSWAEGPWGDVGRNADNIRFEPINQLILVGYGGEPGTGALTVIPLAPLLPVADGGQPSPPHSPADFLFDRPRQADPSMEVQLPSHPESFQLDQANHRMFVNVPDEHEIAVISLGTNLSVSATWPVTAGEKNFPMAFDPASSRLFIATRKPPRLVEYDTATGRALCETPCVGDADDLFFDTGLHRVYVIGGEGFVDVFHAPEKGTAPIQLAHLPTAPRARTGLFIPELNLLAVAAPHTTNRPAAVLLYRLTP